MKNGSERSNQPTCGAGHARLGVATGAYVNMWGSVWVQDKLALSWLQLGHGEQLGVDPWRWNLWVIGFSSK